MDEASLKVPKMEGSLVAANGVIRTGKSAIKAGGADIISDIAFDLAEAQSRCRKVTFENPAPKGTSARPAATVAWRGPVGEPVRKVEIAPLMAAISLRAMDSEMQKLNEQRALPVSAPLVPSLATETPSPAPLRQSRKPRRRPKPTQGTAGPARCSLDPIIN